ncbi:MAG: hypothetical protein E7304_07465 [Butyrivibrio sp.]|uniref:hypothetical protein n=1 Tax=Butyrivibrio sp. TaxID=28121 RepID=UPI001EC13F7A|nr:hypothetical protein [Butyrivibrio sp.]MBE5841225.1 hypothetical protein [Butyrivibrio sp.]
MEYYWARDYKTYEGLKKLFDNNGIKYELSTERVLTDNHILRYQKIYIFHIDASYRNRANRLLVSNRDYTTDEYCLSKYIKFDGTSKHKNVRIIIYIITVILLFFLVEDLGLRIRNLGIFTIFAITWVTIFCLHSAKRIPLAISLAVAYESFLVSRLTEYFWHAYKFEFVSLKTEFTEVIPFFLIFFMFVSLIYLAWNGLKRYRDSTKRDKWVFIGSVFVGIFLILITTIYNYSYLYESYYDDIYNHYASMCESEIKSEKVKPEKIGDYSKLVFYIDEDNTLRMTSYYEGSDNVNKEDNYIWPYEMYVFENGKPKYLIKPAIKLTEEKYHYNNDYPFIFLKYSMAVYFNSNYGDAVPVAEIVKDFTLQESLLATFAEALVVAIVLAIMQKFIEENMQENESKIGRI